MASKKKKFKKAEKYGKTARKGTLFASLSAMTYLLYSKKENIVKAGKEIISAISNSQKKT